MLWWQLRIFDAQGRLMAVSHHLGALHAPATVSRSLKKLLAGEALRACALCTAGKNPYGELDVLGSMPQSQLGGA